MHVITLATGSTGNCYKIECQGSALLIECGISYKKIQQGLMFKMSDIQACLVTHEHLDHSKSVKDILDRGIDVYMSPGTQRAIGIEHYRLKNISPKETKKIGDFSVMAFDVRHDAEEPVGFYIKHIESGRTLLFMTDTYYSPYTFNNVNVMMLECNYVKELMEKHLQELSPKLKRRVRVSHMELETLKEFLKKCDLTETEKIYLIHLSDGNSDEERMKREIQEVSGKEVIVC